MHKLTACLAICLLITICLSGCRSTSDDVSQAAEEVDRSTTASSIPAASTEDRELALRTMKSMRVMAVACEAYAIDWGYYPTAQSSEELSALVTPIYALSLEAKDAWGNPFKVSSSKDGYVFRSYGRDGKNDGGPPSGLTNDLDADIVFSDTRFTQAPFDDFNP